EYKGLKVPEVLLSGNFAAIEDWKYEKALEITEQKRPDLLKK
nr:tRNA (guanosine(37)-N1)-methyltransferase TrmD [Cloacibacterium sp.]